jgi:hypothetical protein
MNHKEVPKPNKNQLLAAIEAAFGTIGQPQVMLHPQCKDDMDIAAFYPYQNWQDIPSQLLSYEYAGLGPASAEAFQFLLPAYMRFAIQEADSANGTIDTILLALQPDKTLFDFQVSKYECLTPLQKTIILDFLDFMMTYDPKEALAAKECLDILWADN